MTLGNLKLHGTLLLAAAALLAGCSGIPLKERDAAQRSRYEAYAGPPVDRFTWFGHYYGWEDLGPTDLVVWTTPFQAYLIKVDPPCTDLPFVNHIGLTSTQNTVSSRFDFVKVRGWRCPIREIRPIDYQRMRQDMQKEAEGSTGAKSQSGN